ncbi:MAG: glycosyltransferase [Spirochaetales bacterium]|nr:glycosyltransferase [Spirochaetales bacterium]
MQVSVIIPALNEEETLGRTLRCLNSMEPPAFECIVVDGGSSDHTVAIADSLGARVLVEKPGRSRQLNSGAREATGDILCFVHADTLVPDDLVVVLRRTLADERISLGGFISLMAGPDRTRWGTSFHNFIKTYYAPLLFRPFLFLRGGRLLFGDQVMFCRRADFLKVGGFDPDLPIMEEADLCIKLSYLGRVRQVNRVVQSSDRRVAKWGALKANAIFLYIGMLWGLGVSGHFLKKAYKDVR